MCVCVCPLILSCEQKQGSVLTDWALQHIPLWHLSFFPTCLPLPPAFPSMHRAGAHIIITVGLAPNMAPTRLLQMLAPVSLHSQLCVQKPESLVWIRWRHLSPNYFPYQPSAVHSATEKHLIVSDFVSLFFFHYKKEVTSAESIYILRLVTISTRA